jgi:hypothetical protein
VFSAGRPWREFALAVEAVEVAQVEVAGVAFSLRPSSPQDLARAAAALTSPVIDRSKPRELSEEQ